MSIKGIELTAGKTIERVIVKKPRDANERPFIQVFFVFTDNTAYELYSSEIGFAGGLDKGGREAVIRYMNSSMGVVFEGFLDETGVPTCVRE